MIPHTRVREFLEENPEFVRLTDWPALCDIARCFATSPSMMRYRLEQLGYIVVRGKEITPGMRLRERPLL
jgi:hypothetical protein